MSSTKPSSTLSSAKRCLTLCTLLASLTVMTLSLPGCGGGSSGSGPAPPQPTPTPGGACNSTTYTPNYVASTQLLHWASFPLRVYFIRDTNYTQTREELATEGFDRWVTATGGGASYTVVTDPAQANVTVSFFRFTGGPGDTLGETNVEYTPSNNTIRRAQIELGITTVNATDIATAAHEYGHALGIAGHSENRRDLMFPSANSTGNVSEADLNTLLTAYCGQFNRNDNTRNERSTEPTRTITLHHVSRQRIHGEVE